MISAIGVTFWVAVGIIVYCAIKRKNLIAALMWPIAIWIMAIDAYVQVWDDSNEAKK